jgi:Ion channel
MWVLGCIGSLLFIILILIDAFEAMVQPRRVTRRFRLARIFYRTNWTVWRLAAFYIPSGKHRESYLSLFGPLSMLALFVTWMLALILGFAWLHHSLETALRTPDSQVDFLTYVYLSGVTFSTLGFGDVVAVASVGRMLTVAEAALGFGFLACVIGYLPAIFQAFSRREVTISLLDARAGSPPCASQLLMRAARARNSLAVIPFLAEWERWAAELLESHLSFPVLSYYRSQHDNQSWLAALTTILDTCALIIAGVRDIDPYQAQLTFAMARHAAVDLALIFRTPPHAPRVDRLPPERLKVLREAFDKAGLTMDIGAANDAKLTELRGLYEPFVNALAEFFMFNLPPVVVEKPTVDNWQTSAWTQRTPGIGHLSLDRLEEGHFG